MSLDLQCTLTVAHSVPSSTPTSITVFLTWCVSGDFPGAQGCIEGVGGCQTCANTLACQACDSGLFLVNGECTPTCPGTVTDGECTFTKELLSGKTQVHLDHLVSDMSISFEDEGMSAVTADGRCLRMHAKSNQFNGSVSFSSLRATFVHDEDRRRVSAVGSSIDVSYSASASSGVIANIQYFSNNRRRTVTDPGPIITVADDRPPRFIFCPADLTITAAAGELEAEANWIQASAVDNVELDRVEHSAEPGTLFSVRGSPHTGNPLQVFGCSHPSPVLSTAFDTNGLEEECRYWCSFAVD